MKSFKTFALRLKELIAFLAFTLLRGQIFANPYVLFGTVGSGPVGSGGGPSNLVVIDQNTGAVEQTIGTIGHLVNGLTYDPTTGNLYASTSANDPIAPSSTIIIDTKTATATIIAYFPCAPGADAMTLVTTDSTGEMYYGWIRAGDADLRTFTMSLDFNNAGTLYLVDGDQTIYTIDTTTKLQTSVGTSASIAHHGKFNPITNQLWAIDAAYDMNPRNIVILDIPSGAIINTLPTIDNLRTLAFAPLSCINGETRRN